MRDAFLGTKVNRADPWSLRGSLLQSVRGRKSNAAEGLKLERGCSFRQGGQEAEISEGCIASTF